MTPEEFAVVQRDDMRYALSNLIHDCLRRFLKAAQLVSLRGPVIDAIDKARFESRIDLTPLLPAWGLICQRYRQERFDAQGKLFEDQSRHALERWSHYLHWELFPSLVREDEFVRNVLRVSLLLPCRSTMDAASALCHQIAEMNLPYGTPMWDEADIE
ncbi:MAG TPA: hypothetical protein VG860_05750 [Terriglobia bacterium]|jgi:hypothetical protein|nr:hypothetical protein [Terriglobia bacterium]